MSVQHYVLPDTATAAKACAEYVIGCRPATLAISGGGTARYLFEALLATEFRNADFHLFWVDERCVPPDDPASNYGVAEQCFIRPARIPPSRVHRIRGELPPDAAAAEYEREIRDFFSLADGEFPRFDLVHLGMGPDAHTASLVPGDPLLNDREGIAAATYVEKFAQWRVTLLPGVLLAANRTVFLAAGTDKQEALQGVFQDEYDPMRYPAQMISRGGRNVTWFLDHAAASLIN